ncbi:DUF1264-domain-containing protein [Gorgonomyces haynaldii]|nr:DUF1264-domain-containing protein [Gorgonomyces haynaldii]
MDFLHSIGSKMQSFTPINQIDQHVCGLHFYAHDTTRVVEAHHYCSHLNTDMHQCVIYDGPGLNARLIGVEYIITKDKFDKLPQEEKQYWHSHTTEVKSGLLFMPLRTLFQYMPRFIVNKIELMEMHHLVGTYGKTWHLWQIDKDDFPYGPPQLMMSFTDDESIPKPLQRHIERKYNVSYDQHKKERKGLPESQSQGADQWQHGTTLQTNMEKVQVKTKP